MIAGRDVKAPIASAQPPGQRSTITEIAFHRFISRDSQSTNIAARTQQRANVMSTRDEFMDEIRADESRSACDEAFHNQFRQKPKATRRLRRLKFQERDRGEIGQLKFVRDTPPAGVAVLPIRNRASER